MIEGAVKDSQLNDENWRLLKEPIEGVQIHEVLHVPRDHGIVTEMYRPEWDPTGKPVVQAYQSRLFPGAIGAWSCHQRQTDRLFVNQGHLKVVLYDGREGTSSSGRVFEHHTGDARPSFVVIPPGVWHGLQNLGASDALVMNFPTEAYDYADPDHWRLSMETPEIPYKWPSHGGTRLRRDAER